MSQRENSCKKEPLISLLENSVYYFLQCAYILKTGKRYRLVVLHQGHVLTDRIFKTLRGAHSSFTKLFGPGAWNKDVKAEWTGFYSPEYRWWKDKTAEIDAAGMK